MTAIRTARFGRRFGAVALLTMLLIGLVGFGRVQTKGTGTVEALSVGPTFEVDREVHEFEHSQDDHIDEDVADKLDLLVNPFAGVAAEAAAARPAVWVGSPGYYNWASTADCSGESYPSWRCAWPTKHHTYAYGDPYVGDWGVDLTGASVGEAVRLYAAPQNTSYNSRTTAHVKNVTASCSRRSGESHSQTIRRGGHTVVVELRVSGTPVGTVKYLHVNPRVSKGQTISRWGTTIGTIGSYTPNSCWTGPHLHLELMNYSNYACFNRGWTSRQAMKPSNFIGFLGGSYASGRGRACP